MQVLDRSRSSQRQRSSEMNGIDKTKIMNTHVMEKYIM